MSQQSLIKDSVAVMREGMPEFIRTSTLIDAAAKKGGWLSERYDDPNRDYANGLTQEALTDVVAKAIGQEKWPGTVRTLLEQRAHEIADEERLAEQNARIEALRSKMTDLGSFSDEALRLLDRRGVRVVADEDLD